MQKQQFLHERGEVLKHEALSLVRIDILNCTLFAHLLSPLLSLARSPHTFTLCFYGCLVWILGLIRRKDHHSRSHYWICHCNGLNVAQKALDMCCLKFLNIWDILQYSG